ncbi:FadR family transcriptional regulator [Devosia sp. XJ19-1]|uniref:FadR family transcriptional regulator n=1 Tax=Devosia ureilytica TaxID=2952754 RepID=A0A9Q4FTK1_9HYPH|nr:FadR/GntR family transcriptional regulator [Devosia ureilytica]MCP8884706.1 FadR family transcriptional regulator [Devosia ureilytica]MCP8888337.1 FadR family transcriptional regulator [Devosia ureilytica]
MNLQHPRNDKGAGTLVIQVANALRSALSSGDYAVGDKLPSEARIAETHGVSRTVVREAIASLRSDGLVEPRRGAGVFVLEPTEPATLPFQNVDHARLSSIIALLELRSAVEVEAAGLAAVRRSPAQEEAIFEFHRAVGQCIAEGKPTSTADFALHTAIADATNNPRFSEFLRVIGQNAIPRAALSSTDPGSSKSYLEQLHLEHANIVTAISDGDAEAAREAMRVHLQGSQRRYRALLQTT